MAGVAARTLGKSGIAVSAMGMGCWAMALGPLTEAQMAEIEQLLGRAKR